MEMPSSSHVLPTEYVGENVFYKQKQKTKTKSQRALRQRTLAQHTLRQRALAQRGPPSHGSLLVRYSFRSFHAQLTCRGLNLKISKSFV